jgi:hypothetical protein
MEKWIGDDLIPLPNGVPHFELPEDEPVKDNYIRLIDILRDTQIQSSYNEIFLFTKYGQKKYAIAFEHKDLKIVFTDQPILEGANENYYLVTPKVHMEDLEEYLPHYDTILEKGIKILFLSFHESGVYPNFYKWINENKYYNQIYTITPCYNINDFAKGNHIFFSFLTYDLDHNFKSDGSIFSVCSREMYDNTAKRKNILSFNRNVKRNHRFWFYNFCRAEDIIDDNYISFLEFPYEHVESYPTMGIPELEEYKKVYMEEGIHEEISVDVRKDDPGYVENLLHNWNNDAWLYAESLFSIVLETKFFERDIMVSEKVLRPIANCHPFIVIGPRYTTKIMEDIGFYVPPFLDYEMLDKEEFPWLRLIKIFNEIRKLLKYINEHNELPPFDMDKIEQNQKLLLSFDKKDTLYNTYLKLIKPKII